MGKDRGTMRTVVGLLLLAVAATASAQGKADLAACRRTYDEQQPEKAVSLCVEAAEDPGAGRATIAAAWEIAGMAQLLLDQQAPARASFCQVITADPRHRPTDPSYNARMMAVFDAVRASGCTPPVRLEIERTTGGGKVDLRIRVKGLAPGGARLEVRFRETGEPKWQSASAAAAQTDAVTLSLPSAALEGRDLEYHVLLLSGERTLARAGTPDDPWRISQAKPRVGGGTSGGPGFWGWVKNHKVLTIAISTVVVAAIVVVPTVVSTRSESPHGSLGTFQLP
jgi:hypothetical protein